MTEYNNVLLGPQSGGLKTDTWLPNSIAAFGDAGRYCWEEFFSGQIRNRHTRAAYTHHIRRFLAAMESQNIALRDISPGMIGRYFDEHRGSIPTKKLALSAIKAFFDHLVVRHILIFSPAASVRGERYSAEGKTPEIPKADARKLLATIDPTHPVGRRDVAIIAVLIYTTARRGAAANLRIGDLTWDGSQYQLRFTEKNGKSRQIPVRHDLQVHLLSYLDSFDWRDEPKEAPLFRSIIGRTGRLTRLPVSGNDIYRMMKRRLVDAGLSTHLSPHSFRVTTITDLLENGVELEAVQQLAGHADPRTTRLYDRRQRRITRNTVERISI
ncbi:Tyrosine recombinase XerC [Caulifigura coniformis]|uniref:Tyrosine recombinase XerC n=1 Tax=Caulifigura coniformis TaxID=2527983 RepID=A0A517SA60_9PLAN|nr:tyrosine-type recombinase/integrase [Caulifigura coniformis]QDT53020.1 Tyrosine recombinase XerC [Caulifigura coniformis]